MKCMGLAVVGLLLLGCMASAPPRDTGRQIRRVTQTTATSDCIGDPRTPLCALDTLVACTARRDHSLCNRALWRDMRVLWPAGTARGTAEYVVAESKVMTKSDIDSEIVTLAGPHVPGDIRFVLLERYCSATLPICKSGGWYLTYYWVRKKHDSWRLIAWIAEGADT